MSTGSVQASSQNCDDGQHVFGKLALGGLCISIFCHNDLCSVSCTNKVDEIECEAAQAVFVGHIQFAYLSTHDFLQNLVEPRPFEVESTADVGDNGTVFAELGDECAGLVAEEVLLLPGGDSGIDNVDTGCRFWGVIGVPDNAGKIVSSGSFEAILDVSDLPVACPHTEGGVTHPEHFARFRWGDESRLMHSSYDYDDKPHLM